jgi:GT2 family glycosyltransferase
MKNLFTIGIPTLNRADLLNPTLKKYVRDFPATDILVVDNGCQKIFEHPNIYVYPFPRNLGVAASWNYLCRLVFDQNSKCSWVNPRAWLINDDVYMGKSQSEIFDVLHDASSMDAKFVANLENWSNFFIHRDCFEKVGPFDENFYPAYFEDNDYRYRMKLGKVVYFGHENLQPEVFRSSMTRTKDPSLNEYFQKNELYYEKKWGGPPGEERFRVPFDGVKQNV